MFSQEDRPLNERERRRLQRNIEECRKRIRKHRKFSLIIFTVIFPIIALAIIALALHSAEMSWKRRVYLTGMTLCGYLGAFLWAFLSACRDEKRRIAKYEEALRQNIARESRIASEAMVELEEIEDLGACYAFQVEERKIVFVCGQEYYQTRNFPNTDFSIVEIYDSKRLHIEEFIEKRGVKLRPLRVITAQAQHTMRLPADLEVVTGTLDEVENLLAEEAKE